MLNWSKIIKTSIPAAFPRKFSTLKNTKMNNKLIVKCNKFPLTHWVTLHITSIKVPRVPTTQPTCRRKTTFQPRTEWCGNPRCFLNTTIHNSHSSLLIWWISGHTLCQECTSKLQTCHSTSSLPTKICTGVLDQWQIKWVWWTTWRRRCNKGQAVLLKAIKVPTHQALQTDNRITGKCLRASKPSTVSGATCKWAWCLQVCNHRFLSTDKWCQYNSSKWWWVCSRSNSNKMNSHKRSRRAMPQTQMQSRIALRRKPIKLMARTLSKALRHKCSNLLLLPATPSDWPLFH